MVPFGQKEAFMAPANDWIEKNKNIMKESINTLCTIPTQATDEAPTERVLNWGAEMARVHFHVQESLPKMIEKYGPFDDLMIQLEDRLETLGKEIESATGKTMALRVKAPRLVGEPGSTPSSPSGFPGASDGSDDEDGKKPKKKGHGKQKDPKKKHKGLTDSERRIKPETNSLPASDSSSSLPNTSPRKLTIDTNLQPTASAPDSNVAACHVCGEVFEPPSNFILHKRGVPCHEHCLDLCSSESGEGGATG